VLRALASGLNQGRVERQARRRIGRAGDPGGPVVVGPWISEVGFEVLYWVPLLRRLVADGRLDPRRTISITRGGAAAWYADVADRHLELFDVFTPAEFKERNEQRAAAAGGQKHMRTTDLDREILRRFASELPAGATMVHPSLMYNAFRYLWAWRTPPASIARQVRYAPLPESPLGARPDLGVDGGYVAVKAYFSDCFPDTPDNRAFLDALLGRLAERHDVVVLTTGIEVDDHREPTVGGGRIVDARRWMEPRDNLATQTRIIRGARALITTYGGFSYLGPFVGVPSVCFYSDPNFNPTHLAMMRQAADTLGGPGFVPLHVRDLDVLHALLATRDPTRP